MENHTKLSELLSKITKNKDVTWSPDISDWFEKIEDFVLKITFLVLFGFHQKSRMKPFGFCLWIQLFLCQFKMSPSFFSGSVFGCKTVLDLTFYQLQDERILWIFPSTFHIDSLIWQFKATVKMCSCIYCISNDQYQFDSSLACIYKEQALSVLAQHIWLHPDPQTLHCHDVTHLRVWSQTEVGLLDIWNLPLIFTWGLQLRCLNLEYLDHSLKTDRWQPTGGNYRMWHLCLMKGELQLVNNFITLFMRVTWKQQ